MVEGFDFNTLTVTELKDIAKELGIVGYSSMLKADLIQAIQLELGLI